MIATMIMKIAIALAVMTTASTASDPTGTTSEDCNVADIVFLVDSSGSIDLTEWAQQIEFLRTMVEGLTIGPDAIQVGIVTFATSENNEFYLNAHTTRTGVVAAIDGIIKIGGGTGTSLGLGFVRTESFTAARGDRPSAPNVCIVLTDGASSANYHPSVEAGLLRDAGVAIIAIGVGTGDRSELEAMASSPSYVFEVTDFSALQTIRNEVLNVTCKASITTEPTRTTTETSTTTEPTATTTIPSITTEPTSATTKLPQCCCPVPKGGRPVPQGCRPGFTGVGNVCYSIPNMKATWIDAVTMCKAQGAYLADINSFAEYSLVVGLAKQVPGLAAVYLGATLNAPVTGEWRWIHNGLPVTYIDWYTHQPDNNGGHENCLELMKNFGYKYNDITCSLERHFVCKYYQEKSSNCSCCRCH